MKNKVAKRDYVEFKDDEGYYKCPICGGSHFKHLGTAQIKTMPFEGYRCISCGEEIIISHDLMYDKIELEQENELKRIISA